MTLFENILNNIIKKIEKQFEKQEKEEEQKKRKLLKEEELVKRKKLRLERKKIKEENKIKLHERKKIKRLEKEAYKVLVKQKEDEEEQLELKLKMIEKQIISQARLAKKEKKYQERQKRLIIKKEKERKAIERKKQCDAQKLLRVCQSVQKKCFIFNQFYVEQKKLYPPSNFISDQNKHFFINSNKQAVFLGIEDWKSAIRNGISRRIENLTEYWYRGEFLKEKHNYIIEMKPKNAMTTYFEFVIEFKYWQKTLTAIPTFRNLIIGSEKIVKNIAIAEKNDYFLYQNEFFKCSKYREESFGNICENTFELKEYYENNLPKSNTLIIDEWNILISYDCETTKFCTVDESYNKLQNPYLLSATINMNLPFLFVDNWCTWSLEHVDLSAKSTIGEQFFDKIRNLIYEHNLMAQRGLTIKIFGYNNNKFDNNFVIGPFIEDGCFVSARERNGRTSSAKIIFRGVHIDFCDVIKWVPDMNLKEACSDYEITMKKLNVDIVKYNKACTEAKSIILNCDETTFYSFGSFSLKEKINLKKEFFNYENKTFRIYDYIRKYCEYDTLSVMELFSKLSQVFKEIKEAAIAIYNVTLSTDSFIDYNSPATFAGHLNSIIMKKNEEKLLKINDAYLFRFIFSTYFGGRVDYGFLGEYISQNKSICFMDVTSEYPLAMTGLYPSIKSMDDILYGDEINLDYYQFILDTCLFRRNEAFENKTLENVKNFLAPLDKFRAIFLCDICAPKEKYNLIQYSAIPSKGEEKILYNNYDQKNRVLNSVQFKNLILSGFSIKLLPCKYNIVFKRVDFVFKEFIEQLGKLKTEAKKDSNRTKAKLIKLLLNAIAGKLAQKPNDKIRAYDFVPDFDKEKSFFLAQEYKREDWSKSKHYLATFITAEANWILYSTLYKLQLDYIYDKKPMEERCGTCLYMDTDSIAFDKELINLKYYNFVCSEELGYYCPKICDFYVTWKEKYTLTNNIDRMIIIAKKSYCLLDGKKIIELKLKGIHKEEMNHFKNYDELKKIVNEMPKTINFEGLEQKRVHYNNFKNLVLPQNYEILLANDNRNFLKTTTNTEFTPQKVIYSTMLKKTLTKDANDNELACKNQNVYNMNKQNLEKTEGNFLAFYYSPFSINKS